MCSWSVAFTDWHWKYDPNADYNETTFLIIEVVIYIFHAYFNMKCKYIWRFCRLNWVKKNKVSVNHSVSNFLYFWIITDFHFFWFFRSFFLFCCLSVDQRISKESSKSQWEKLCTFQYRKWHSNIITSSVSIFANSRYTIWTK